MACNSLLLLPDSRARGKTVFRVTNFMDALSIGSNWSFWRTNDRLHCGTGFLVLRPFSSKVLINFHTNLSQYLMYVSEYWLWQSCSPPGSHVTRIAKSTSAAWVGTYIILSPNIFVCAHLMSSEHRITYILLYLF